MSTPRISPDRRWINFDLNATTPLDPQVAASMADAMQDPDLQGNPSSPHRLGQRVRARLESARRQVAAAVGADSLEVTFVSGGTEADNLGVYGVAARRKESGLAHAVACTAIDHPAVLSSAARAKSAGLGHVQLACDEMGRISKNSFSQTLAQHPEIGVLALSAANHELGNLYQVEELCRLARASGRDIHVHVDAVQAFGKVPVDFGAWEIDSMAISAHKIYGPKGIGALVHRRTLQFVAPTTGGGQERGLRPGTENFLGAVGFGEAATLAAAQLHARSVSVRERREQLLKVVTGVEGVEIVGDQQEHVGNTICVVVRDCLAELLIMALDAEQIAVSAGAACSSGALEGSAVIRALGRQRDDALASLRFSVGITTSSDDILRFAEVWPILVGRCREATAMMREQGPK